MTSTRSYNSLGKNVRDQLHRMKSAILLLAVLYLAIGPVWFLLQLTSWQSQGSFAVIANLFMGYFTPFYFLAVALGTVGALYVTRYQNVPQQSNFYHSLPVTRPGLYSARILALVLVQVLLLIVVTMVDVVIVVMVSASQEQALTLNLTAAAGLHFCYIMLVFLLALAVGLLAGQLTANTIGQVLMTAVLHFSVPCLGAVLGGITSAFSETVARIGVLETLTRFNILTGFMGTVTSVSDRITSINPIFDGALAAANFAPQQILWPLSTTLLHILLTVAFFTAAYALYERRAVEKAGDTLLYPLVGSIIKGLYVFLGAIVIGLFFWEVMQSSFIGLLLGAVVAVIVVHLTCEMLYSMDVDGVRRHYLSSLVGMVCALAVGLGLQSGLVDLDQHLPKAESVKGAVIAYSGENDNLFNIASPAATDPDTIAKVMAAAEEAKAKDQHDLDWEDPDTPDVVTVSLAYDTFFGKSSRDYTLTIDDAQAIMGPLQDDTNVNAAAWSIIADATIDDVIELFVSPVFSYFIGGYDTYLIQDADGGNGSGDNLVRDTADGRARAEALLAAMQEDLAARDRSVLQSRVLARVGYGILYDAEHSYANFSYNNGFTIYEGDKACAALLAQWREEGFLDDEATQMNEILEGCEAVVYDLTKGEEESRLGTLSSEDFVNAYLAGDLVDDTQMRTAAVPVQDGIAIDLYTGSADDADTTVGAVYYLREGATLQGLASE